MSATPTLMCITVYSMHFFTLIIYRQKTKGKTGKGESKPGDAMSHYVEKSNFRTTQKLITAFPAHNF